MQGVNGDWGFAIVTQQRDRCGEYAEYPVWVRRGCSNCCSAFCNGMDWIRADGLE